MRGLLAAVAFGVTLLAVPGSGLALAPEDPLPLCGACLGTVEGFALGAAEVTADGAGRVVQNVQESAAFAAVFADGQAQFLAAVGQGALALATWSAGTTLDSVDRMCNACVPAVDGFHGDASGCLPVALTGAGIGQKADAAAAQASHDSSAVLADPGAVEDVSFRTMLEGGQLIAGCVNALTAA